ncbi:Uncharacterized protein TCM_036996 isoform 1 [Theobroma cacao]|uniref:Uncharacterized protein isoform 1 n=2 Tax=Theobroma cacao TaxID=3641 RepID=A0A061GQQ2_THECC|nr:Uncharacterized protein TCM_036996 isoform 1 [Theobroma cacao]EOY29475.1 Uncharacterized protein TCM_036996 isoform 1 [Theobroma cacao]
MKWAVRSPMKRLHVKVKPLKLEGLRGSEEEDEGVSKKMVLVEMVWKRPKSGLVPFYKSSSRHRRDRSSVRIVGNGKSIEWDDEFESLCDFPSVSKDRASGSWDALFNVLHGEDGENRGRLAVVGKVSLNLAELVSEMECSEIERKVPITLNVDGSAIKAILSILVSFAEVRGPPDTAGSVQSSAESNKEDGFFKMVKGLTRQKKEKRGKTSCQKKQPSSCDSDESLIFDSDGLHGSESTTTSESSSGELSLGPELESSQSLETTQNHMVRLFPRKKRQLSFRSFRKKTESLTNENSESNESDVHQRPRSCSVVDSQDSSCWEVKELVGRNEQSRLKTNVFFASFDQRSERAYGESACTALVAVIAHWLHSNQDFMPTRLQFDSLITEGSSEWRKLCDNITYTNSFPDKHFDLETVLEADLRPVTVLKDKSFTGFFSPEKFECLKGAMSFDEIWDEISSDRNDCAPRVYIVSWNDHFFVLKAESNAYYIIDSLGERLFEGCNQAYMLKFDGSSLLYGKKAGKQEACSSEETGEAERKEGGGEEVICSGKECCREYIKRFLAAIPVGELEEEEKKGTASTFSLHQRLQIDFHYSSSSSSSCSSSATSSTDFLM